MRPLRTVFATSLLGAVLLGGCVERGTDPPTAGSIPGSILLSVRVVGNGADRDGFELSLLGKVHTLFAGGTVRLWEVPPGEHEVRLGGVADHCASESDRATVTVESQRTTEREFVIECYGELVYSQWYGPLDDALFYLDQDGVSRKLTPAMTGGQWSARWAPDGSRVLFERMEEEQSDLFVADLHGATRALATRPHDRETDAAWSPDGEWVVYVLVSGWTFSQTDLRLVRADGTGDRSLLNDGGIALSPVWSPDGQFIAFACWRAEHGICFITPDGDLLGRSPIETWQPQRLSWSPDGIRISFEDFARDGQSIEILDVFEGTVTPALPGTSGFGPQHWSPDGRFLATMVHEDGEYGIYVAAADGGNTRQVVRSGARWVGNWSPNGAKLAVGLVANEVHIASTETLASRPLFGTNASLANAYWRPGGPTAGAVQATTLGRRSPLSIARSLAEVHGRAAPSCTARIRIGADRGATYECVSSDPD